MDALELRQTLLNDLVAGLKKSVEERNDTSSAPHFNYLTGRIETLRTIVEFLVNLQVDGPTPQVEAEPKRKKAKEAK